MTFQQEIPFILEQYGLAETFSIDRIGSGYIHDTFKVRSGQTGFILQRVNTNVFPRPEIIAANLRHAADYLRKKFPSYPFLDAVRSNAGAEMVYDTARNPWRLFPYIEHTFTIDKVSTAEEAFSAAAEFGRLTAYLEGLDPALMAPTIDRFHDLGWRWDQFRSALQNPAKGRAARAVEAIEQALGFGHLVDKYKTLINSGDLVLRVTHNDTKINNILFDSKTRNAVCAIDLDTLMPGYFIYDLGDMIRTFVSPVDEEERDLSKVYVRRKIYDAVLEGYLSQMSRTLRAAEIKAIPFAGLMMTYIMALRMLTDFLNGDVYYKIRFEDQNLVRALNQLKLLVELQKVSL